MAAGRGWVGVMSQVLHYLSVVGADRDEDGKFLVTGDVVTFLGMGGENAETVVGPDACYFVNGRKANLASGLGSTSYGTRPVVIM